MTGTAADRWRSLLMGWAIPQAILDVAPTSPYGFPKELFRERAARADARADTPTTRRALEAIPGSGTVLDVGVGGGATSLPLARRASRITGVDGQSDMLEVFLDAAAARGAEADAIHGTWPDVEGQAPAADVVVSGHVVYNVADLVPFVRALGSHAGKRVVLELTDGHPLTWMNDLWSHFHGLDRPTGPTDRDAIAVLDEMRVPVVDERTVIGDDPAGGGFQHREDALAMVRRRLCLPPDRDDELARALGERLRAIDGMWTAGPLRRTVVTLWWNTA